VSTTYFGLARFIKTYFGHGS